MSEPKLFGYDLYRDSREKLLDEINQGISENRLTTIISLNTLKLYQGEREAKTKSLFVSGTHVIPDGQSMVFADYLINRKRILAISGAELMVEVIKRGEEGHYKIFFLGAEQILLDKVKEKLRLDFPNVYSGAKFQHGFYSLSEEQSVIRKIAESNSDIVFVAFGSPRKEKFIVDNKQVLNAKVLMGVGGSYEYFVGEVKLGALSKRLGLRWLIRLFQDPKRLAKRYLICNGYFLYALIRDIVRSLGKSTNPPKSL